jgi:hypothetical protein
MGRVDDKCRLKLGHDDYDTNACNTNLEIKLRPQMVLASEITIQK